MIGALLVDAGAVVVAGMVGHFEGYLMGSKVRNLSALVIEPPPEPFVEETRVCICSHPVVGHAWVDNAKRWGSCKCHAVGDKRLNCACQRYVPKPDKKKPAPNVLDLS